MPVAIFADLHIHIGRASRGEPVKITASRDLSLPRILAECRERKGIGMAGVIDSASPAVLEDIRDLLRRGELHPLPGGGLGYGEALTLILGAEMELAGPRGGSGHYLAYVPTLEAMEELSRFLATETTNIGLSSQRVRLSPPVIGEFVNKGLDGLFLPAHAFTPFKGVFGSCVARLAELGVEFAGIELGLSADSALADRIPELRGLRFLSNSDAHSLPKIAREYNELLLQEPDFYHLQRAVHGDVDNIIIANYGLDPRLGKYHRTYCLQCEAVADGRPPIEVCPICGDSRVTMGVLDRIVSISPGQETQHPPWRPPYIHQIPLEFVPGVGPKTLARLLQAFGTEMQILHYAQESELAEVVGNTLAGRVMAARTGDMAVDVGGGGRYGRVGKGES